MGKYITREKIDLFLRGRSDFLGDEPAKLYPKYVEWNPACGCRGRIDVFTNCVSVVSSCDDHKIAVRPGDHSIAPEDPKTIFGRIDV